jgi:cbb3-type cytochrome oxidase cytochrome c subunit
MPATEQTWRSTRLLHVVFGLSGLAMLAATVAMLYFDHAREFKQYKRTFTRIETWTAQARINEQASSEYQATQRKLEGRLRREQLRPLNGRVVKSLLQEIEQAQAQDAAYRKYDLAALRARWEAYLQARRDQAAEDEVRTRRSRFLDGLQQTIREARFIEDMRQTRLKFRRGDLSEVLSNYDLAVHHARPAEELAAAEAAVKAVQHDVDRLLASYEQAKLHRTELQQLYNQLTADEAAARKALEDHQAQLNRLVAAMHERADNIGKRILQLPIIDAFGGPLKPDQIWLPELTQNYNHKQVARFDRCITCHQGIDKTQPGSATLPAYPHTQRLFVRLQTPAEAPAAENADRAALLEKLYGLRLAEAGLVDAADVTIDVVRPYSAAAQAELAAGDVIEAIAPADAADYVNILDRQMAYTYLLESVRWGKPLLLRIRRGLPHPYSTHPRLDLFVGSLSPHRMQDMGCTICHEGQGSATAFKWASHTPANPLQMGDWELKHGWFFNHHWVYPMLPKRFVEASCLKCHHEVTELEPSERFPDPPAPKLVRGYHLIRQYGCFGCHEINGYDSPTKRRGPDLRVEPNYFAAAQAVLADPGLNAEERRLAEEVVAHPDRTAVRQRLAESIEQDAAGAGEGHGRLSAETHKLAALLAADEATPGKLPKPGPSLRYVASKLSRAFLHDWLWDPRHFRATTRMPRFFNLHDHLLPEETVDARGRVVRTDSPGLKDAQRFEPIEIRAVAEFLLAASQPFRYESPAPGTEPPSAERGRKLFQTRGCLACHKHEAFQEEASYLGEEAPAMQVPYEPLVPGIVPGDAQGPDLSRIGEKLAASGERGQRWLYTWLRAPHRYHPRTVMPDVQLVPIRHKDGPLAGKQTDPAADITAFLLAPRTDEGEDASPAWRPQELPKLNKRDLDDLVLVYLSATFPRSQAEMYAQQGIPRSLAGELMGDERELLVEEGLEQLTAAQREERLTRQKLRYLGRRTVSRLGCFGCHDIPGYEDAKPIGTSLADWGRKEPEKLAFEQILQYLSRKHGQEEGGAAAHGLDPRKLDPDEGFFVQSLLNHERIGFLWQKLRQPRSYDYKKTENKIYTDRLRMPQFNFTDEEREAVMTFVLGLVAEPPAVRYQYRPDPRQRAVVRGKQVLTKYNCGGCHTLQMETWEFDYDPQEFPPPAAAPGFAFMQPHFTPQQLEASRRVDRRGLGRAVLTGMVNRFGEDDEGLPLWYFKLWKSVAINGEAWVAGGQEVELPEARVVRRRPFVGGDFARRLYPVAVADERQVNPQVDEKTAWGWLPPPLIGEGQKVQTPWLYDFLLDPHEIRPAALLRMPNFHMSAEEAQALADYFAAQDGAEFPYSFDPRSRQAYLESKEAESPGRLDRALNVLTDGTYCVKCHKVGDYTPKGSVTALAPRLDQVGSRLRPDFIRQWLANPPQLLPYTGMPVNFDPVPPDPQTLPRDAQGRPVQKLHFQLFSDSEQAIDAVTDLLLNFDSHLKQRIKISEMVREAPPEQPPAGGG